jgi:hypothetical protein
MVCVVCAEKNKGAYRLAAVRLGLGYLKRTKVPVVQIRRVEILDGKPFATPWQSSNHVFNSMT